ncbi:hypothetical protein LHYA1_G007590 [Lachnellula hyalina]|uniref:Integral membrane protein n=1 Tax=Lachnellula hyalina TaxID=1316788 RepID=A0A8H8QWX3_9HELO|nr:uncharacterized protein LHYA1_G007590 [Lachnellula hyalina]TVY24328.1 hypothetical protein LHYA1_G007590 [Lachnellula hyalina]
METIARPSRWLDEKTANLAKSRWLSHIAIQYYCAFCGVICSIMFCLAFVAADFISPIKPWWDAERTAHHYQVNTTRVRAGAAILVVSGMFYLPFSAVISYQMKRIPNLHYLVHQLQLASAAAGIWTFILPGIILAATSYRPYRPVETTQMFNDFFWICAFMPWPTFIAQNFAFSYAIIVDDRKKPLFPKELAIVNIVTPILFTPAVGIHCSYRGATAYNGAMTFWVPGVTFCLQLVVDSWYLYTSIREESRELDALSKKNISDPEVGLTGDEEPKPE